jgi:hypothetical protein
MPKLTFRGVVVRYVDLRFDEEAGRYVRIHLTSDFSDPIVREMGWHPYDRFAELPENALDKLEAYLKKIGIAGWMEAAGVPSCKLAGEIVATTLELVPSGLPQQAISIECQKLSNFQAFLVTNPDGETQSVELRFIATTTQQGAAASLEGYLEGVGKTAAAMKITYHKQQELFEAANADEEDEEQDTGCVACNNGIALREDGVHESGAKCTRKREQTLASVTAMKKKGHGQIEAPAIQ